MGSVREWDVEGFWVCPACGSTCPGITGAERGSLRCVTCGREKEPEDPWIAPDAVGPENALTGAAAALAASGANVSCAHCGVECRAGAVSCDECGAPLGEGEPTTTPKPEPAPPPARTLIAGPEPARRGPDPGRPFPWKTLVAGLVAVMATGAFIRWVGAERKVSVEVVALEWSRSVRVDQRVIRAGSGWIDTARASREVVGVGACETRNRGVRPCDPYPCRCRPDISCNCTGGDSYSCPPCIGGGTRECNCRRTGAYDCRCTRTRTNRQNGSFRIRESCETCYRGRSCERCAVPRVCRTCTTPRVCQRCPQDRCDTCYRTCPVFGQWCAYTYALWEPLPVARAGATGHSATWPRVVADAGVPTRTTREEHYWVTYRSVEPPFETWRQEVDAATYGRTDYQTRYQAAVTRLNRITLLHPVH